MTRVVAARKLIIAARQLLAGMVIGKWYKQEFGDRDMYFMPQKEQKNGGLAGQLITVELTKYRQPAKSIKSSVSKIEVQRLSLWEEVQPENVPDNVLSLV